MPPLIGVVASLSWILLVDGAVNRARNGTFICLKGPDGIIMEQSVEFNFNPSHNQAKYKALLALMGLAREMGVTKLIVCIDSKVVMYQTKGTYQAKDP